MILNELVNTILPNQKHQEGRENGSVDISTRIAKDLVSSVLVEEKQTFSSVNPMSVQPLKGIGLRWNCSVQEVIEDDARAEWSRCWKEPQNIVLQGLRKKEVSFLRFR